jgi:nucleoside phosphorylase
MSYRSIFLHFANRELNGTYLKKLNSHTHNRLIRTAATITAGKLVAPFSQINEQYDKFPQINKLISALCASDKLELLNSAKDIYHFSNQRKELYKVVPEKYEMYFSGKRLKHTDDFRRDSQLSPTSVVKKTLSNITEGINLPNWIAEEDQRRISRHSDFVKRILEKETVGATYSVYQNYQIEPKPDEEMFLGELSSRIYIKHHCQTLDAVTMTGVYNDHLIEDFDHYPVYDVNIQSKIINLLGFSEIIEDAGDHLNLSALVSGHEFRQFSESRLLFVKTIASCTKSSKVEFGLVGVHPTDFAHQQVICSALDSILVPFQKVVNPTDLSNSALLNERLRILATAAREKFPRFDEENSRLGGDGQSAVTVVLHIATDKEEQVACSLLPARGWSYVKTVATGMVSCNLYRSHGKPDIFLVRSSAGSGTSHGAQFTLQEVVPKIRPRKVISVGICFGVPSQERKIRDVIVSERVTNYEPARLESDGTETHRGDKYPGDAEIISRARALRGKDRAFKVHVGHTLSGEKLVDNRHAVEQLLKIEPKAMGGDMEAAGIAMICSHVNIGFAMIKGIADFAEEKTKDHQTAAAENSVSFALEMIAMGFD